MSHTLNNTLYAWTKFTVHSFFLTFGGFCLQLPSETIQIMYSCLFTLIRPPKFTWSSLCSLQKHLCHLVVGIHFKKHRRVQIVLNYLLIEWQSSLKWYKGHFVLEKKSIIGNMRFGLNEIYDYGPSTCSIRFLIIILFVEKD